MKRWWKRIAKLSWYAFATMFISLAVMVSLAQALTPLLGRYRTQFETFTSDVLKHPVNIGSIKASWHWLHPILHFTRVVVHDKADEQRVLRVSHLAIGINLWQSIKRGEWVPAKVIASGAQLSIHQKQDGRITIDGIDALTKQSVSNNHSHDIAEFYQWLTQQEQVNLSDIAIRYYQADGTVLPIQHLNFSIKNAGDIHYIDSRFTLAQTIATQLEFKGEFEGSQPNPLTWHGLFKLQAKHLDLEQWLGKYTLADMQIRGGVGDIQAKAVLDNGQYTGVSANLDIEHLLLKSQRTNVTKLIPILQGDVSLQHQESGWQLGLNKLNLQVAGTLIKDAKLTFQFNQQWQQQQTVLNIQHLNLTRLLPWAMNLPVLTADETRYLTHLAPTGQLNDVNVVFDNNGTQINGAAKVINLSIQPYEQIPGVKHLSTDLTFTPGQIAFDVDSRHLSVQVPNYATHEYAFKRVHGQLLVQKSQQGFTVSSHQFSIANDDLQLESNFTWQASPDNPLGYLNYIGGFKILKANKASDYLPKKITDPDFYHWMAMAFNRGGNALGTIIVRGKLNDFPFRDNNGTYIVDMNLKDVDLRYNQHWPLVTDLNGELVLRNNTLFAHIFSGNTVGATLHDFDVKIPDMRKHKKVLEVSGNAKLDFRKALRFVRESALEEKLHQLDKIGLDGPLALALDIHIPLGKKHGSTVKGRITTHDAKLKLHPWQLGLTKLAGTIDFTEHNMLAKNLTAEILGQPLQLQVATEQDSKNDTYTQVSAHGRLPLDVIKQKVKSPLLDRLSGTLPYKLSVRIPANTSKKISVALHSQLVGLTSLLPPPLTKATNAILPLSIRGDFLASQTAWLRLHLENTLQAILQIDKNGRLDKGEIVLGKGEVNMPEQPGFVVSGHLTDVNVDDYLDLLNEKSTKQVDYPTLAVRSVQVAIDNLFIRDQLFHHVNLHAKFSSDATAFKLDSDKVKGEITYQPRPKNMLTAKLSHLYIAKSQAKEAITASMKPNSIPKLHVVIDDLRYGKMKLGSVELDSTPSDNDMEIRNLILTSPSFTLRAQGVWGYQQGHMASSFVGEAVSRNFESTLKEWGIPQIITAKKGYFHYALTWPGAPYQFSTKKLDGSLKFELINGLITHLSKETEAKIGIGKLVGILSLQNLPRRLMLDFSDLRRDGLPYDKLAGDFNLKNGYSQTKNTTLDGPMAAATVTGGIGLANKTYDLRITVTPYFATSLPVIATITGGPIAGAATWVASKIVTSQIRKNTHYTYAISGAWKQPNIRELPSKHHLVQRR